MGRSEEVLATQKVNARRVAVRSIDWLGRVRGIGESDIGNAARKRLPETKLKLTDLKIAKWLLRVAALDTGKVIEQRLVRRGIGRTQIVLRLGQAAAKIALPQTVDGKASEPRIIRLRF